MGFRSSHQSVDVDGNETNAKEIPIVISYELWMQNSKTDSEEKYNDDLENEDDMLISIVALMIHFVSELTGRKNKTGKQARFLMHSSIYLTRYILTGTKS